MLQEVANGAQAEFGSVMELDNPVPGRQYLIGLDLNPCVHPALLSVSVPPFTSSKPDLPPSWTGKPLNGTVFLGLVMLEPSADFRHSTAHSRVGRWIGKTASLFGKNSGKNRSRSIVKY
jgi:hypothetical protein